MTYTDLRTRYPKFIFDNYTFEKIDHDLFVKFFYSAPPDHKFSHQIVFKHIPDSVDYTKLVNFYLHIGLSLIPSYWKATCSPRIEIHCGHLDALQTKWWLKLFEKGMGEYYFQNQIDFTPSNFLTLTSTGEESLPTMDITAKESVLIPMGGGKDSITTLEILRPHYPITLFAINPVPVMKNIQHISGVIDFIEVTSTIDPYLLELNSQGYLNGHTPVSSVYAFTALAAAAIYGQKHVAFSNERSATEGNTTYLGREINHQYSKTLEFETDLATYIPMHMTSSIDYFSLLRSLYELQIALIFSYRPQYFNFFTSCNKNFKLDPTSHPESLWCKRCPKCVSTGLLLGAFVGKDKISEIMGAYPPDLPENQEIMKELLGEKPVKPFECVLTRREAKLALDMIENGPSDEFSDFLSEWEDNPNLPTELAKILRRAV